VQKSTYRFIQCMLVLGLATYLTEKLINGQLSYYINLRFAIFTLMGILGLVIMSVIGLLPLFTQEQDPPHNTSEGQPSRRKTNWVVLFLFPIIFTLLGLSAPLIFFAYIGVVIIGFSRLSRFQKNAPDGFDQVSEFPATALILLSIPLIFGILVPVRPLSTSSLNTRSIGLSAPASIEDQSVKTMEVAPDDRTVLDWIKIFNYEEDLSSYLGTEANVIGFVYHDPRLEGDRFMISRFVITCCVADAFAIGMAVDWPDSIDLADDTWVNVKGTVDVLTVDGQQVPLIHAQSIVPTQAPEQPYLYP
jgi:putative membrane protein